MWDAQNCKAKKHQRTKGASGAGHLLKPHPLAIQLSRGPCWLPPSLPAGLLRKNRGEEHTAAGGSFIHPPPPSPSKRGQPCFSGCPASCCAIIGPYFVTVSLFFSSPTCCYWKHLSADLGLWRDTLVGLELCGLFCRKALPSVAKKSLSLQLYPLAPSGPCSPKEVGSRPTSRWQGDNQLSSRTESHSGHCGHPFTACMLVGVCTHAHTPTRTLAFSIAGLSFHPGSVFLPAYQRAKTQ